MFKRFCKIKLGASVSQDQSGPITTTSNWPSVQTSTTLKLLKIVSNLVERQEIGQAIINEILLDLLNYVYRECSLLSTLSNQSATTAMHLKSRSAVMMAMNSTATSTQALLLQYAKELNEIKKATCNFLFQSFQLYFIWEFCAQKFEVICLNYTSRAKAENSPNVEHSDPNMINISPAHLCDLYEFILDLLTNTVGYLNTNLLS